MEERTARASSKLMCSEKRQGEEITVDQRFRETNDETRVGPIAVEGISDLSIEDRGGKTLVLPEGFSSAFGGDEGTAGPSQSDSTSLSSPEQLGTMQVVKV
jgi:hypothetical protein